MFTDLAKNRFSVRKFKNTPISHDLLEQILQAGQLAPTACNNQPQRTLVIESEEAMHKLKGVTPYHFNAPSALLVCYDKNISWKRQSDGEDSGVVDASIAATHMMLAAAELGLGTTWVMAFDPVRMREAFDIPENIIPVALFPLGYPADDVKPHPLHEDRLAISNTTEYNTF